MANQLGRSHRGFLWLEGQTSLSSPTTVVSVDSDLQINNAYSISWPDSVTNITNNSISTTDITSTTINGTVGAPVLFPDGLESENIYYTNAYEFDAGVKMTHHNEVVFQDVVTCNDTIKLGTVEPTGPGAVVINGSLQITGNISVDGSVTSISTTNLVVEDNFINQNFGYAINTPKESGVISVRLPAATTYVLTGTFAVAGVDEAQIGTVDASGLAAGDVIQIVGSTSNDGFYEVWSHTGNILSVRSTTPCVLAWSNNNFIAEACPVGTCFAQKVNVSGLEFKSDGTGLQFVRGQETLTMEASDIAHDGSDPEFNTLNITTVAEDATASKLATWDSTTKTVGHRTVSSLATSILSPVTEVIDNYWLSTASESMSVLVECSYKSWNLGTPALRCARIGPFTISTSSTESYLKFSTGLPGYPTSKEIRYINLYFSSQNEECYFLTQTDGTQRIYRKDGSVFPASTTITHCVNNLISGYVPYFTQFDFITF